MLKLSLLQHGTQLEQRQHQQEDVNAGSTFLETVQQVCHIKSPSLQLHCCDLRFAGLFDDDEASDNTPAAPIYHGRASEPAIGLNTRPMRPGQQRYNGARSRDSSLRGGSRSRDGSRDGVYSGRSSVDNVISEDVLRGAQDSDRDKLETKTRTLMEEYLSNVDLREAFTCICELYHAKTISQLIEHVFNVVVEKKDKDRINGGKLFAYLLRNETLQRKEFLSGVESVLEFAEDLLIDIPQFFNYFGVMIATCIVDKVLDINFIKDSSSILKASNLDTRYVSAILTAMSALDSSVTLELWKNSNLNLADFKLEGSEALQFLTKPLVNGHDAPVDAFVSCLDTVLAKQDLNSIFEFMLKEVGAELDNKTLRTLISRVSLSCIDNNNGSFLLNREKLGNFGVTVMKKYLDAVTEKDKTKKELEALFSLQELVNTLEHPNKLLHSLFEALYDFEVISEV